MKKHNRMLIIYKPGEGFKLDVPYSKWLVFCLGASALLRSLPDILAVLVK